MHRRAGAALVRISALFITRFTKSAQFTHPHAVYGRYGSNIIYMPLALCRMPSPRIQHHAYYVAGYDITAESNISFNSGIMLLLASYFLLTPIWTAR